MNYGELIQAPLQDKNWPVKVLLGGFLSIIPIVNLIPGGYLFQALGNATQGKLNLPEWDSWGGKFFQGFLAFFISFLYGLLPFVLLLVGVGTAGLAAYRGSGPWAALFGGGMGIVVFFLYLLIGFVLPMALANAAARGEFGAAFAFAEIMARIKSVLGEYLVSYILVLVLGLVASIVTSIPLIGWILMGPISFYVGIASAYIFGTLYAVTTGEQ